MATLGKLSAGLGCGAGLSEQLFGSWAGCRQWPWLAAGRSGQLVGFVTGVSQLPAAWWPQVPAACRPRAGSCGLGLGWVVCHLGRLGRRRGYRLEVGPALVRRGSGPRALVQGVLVGRDICLHSAVSAPGYRLRPAPLPAFRAEGVLLCRRLWPWPWGVIFEHTRVWVPAVALVGCGCSGQLVGSSSWCRRRPGAAALGAVLPRRSAWLGWCAVAWFWAGTWSAGGGRSLLCHCLGAHVGSAVRSCAIASVPSGRRAGARCCSCLPWPLAGAPGCVALRGSWACWVLLLPG